ncbi:hypothetical protein SAMN05880501_10374 [Ureibacillus xyleni]|uniref:Stage VI sporulation protein D n=1 Tax=Ureibacillus xyleni TaxID=614648 RepID=A0A285S5M4_9BACL|nr:hypothetical protein [Ureibacillus xyleni]SOC02612.1 hypothetical protein SAMN05880501_10374 [Ureibacillus xyleni]
MQNINWDMMTQFVFPEQLGLVEEVISCNIIPRWQQIETEDSIQLHGIYHITAVARFNPNEIPQYSEGTLIEELEFDGNNGYFEYALPLNVDLPREKVAPTNKPELEIDNIQFLVYDGCSCTFKWEVNCSFEEPVQGALFNYEPTEEPPIINYRTEEPQQEIKEIRFGHDAIFPEEPNFGDFPVLNVTETNEDGQTIEEVAPARNEEYATPQEVVPEETLAPEQNMVPLEDIAPAQQVEPIEEIPVQQVTPIQNVAPASQEVPVDEVIPIQPVDMQDDTPTLDNKTSNTAIREVHLETWNDSSSSGLDLATDVVVNQGTIIQDIDEKQSNSQIEEPQKKEKIIHSNQYFPTDADDFYNELKESYTILNISNKIRHE